VFSVIPKPVSKNVVLYTVVRALGRVYGSPADPGRPASAG
jgi:two-component system, response regulator PdtaR